MAMFSYQDHKINDPTTWIVKKHGRKWGLFTQNHENPLDTFNTKIEANLAKTTGRLVDLYQKEAKWYAGEVVAGWKSYSPPKRTPN